jgi:hypothetical protein
MGILPESVLEELKRAAQAKTATAATAPASAQSPR